jgi:hypothetical protein
LDATFSGTTQLLGASCSASFSVLAPVCSPTPATGCQAPAAQKASLRIAKSATSSTNKMTWKWTSGGAVGLSDFGSPTTTSDHVMCLYDDAGLKMTAHLPAGGMCGTKPCWRTLGTIGFKYRNKSGVPDGLTSALLRAGSAGHGKVQVKGKNVPLATLPLTTPVRVQLRQVGSSTCWEASYIAASRNTPTGFKATSP